MNEPSSSSMNAHTLTSDSRADGSPGLPSTQDLQSTSESIFGDVSLEAIRSIDATHHTFVEGIARVAASAAQRPEVLESVGKNVLDGLGAIAEAKGLPVADVVGTVADGFLASADVYEAFQHGNPYGAVAEVLSNPPPIGLLKLVGAVINLLETSALLLGVQPPTLKAAKSVAIERMLGRLFYPLDRRPSIEEAKRLGYEIDGWYFSADKGRTWWLARGTPSGVIASLTGLGLLGKILAILSSGLAAVALLVSTGMCSMPSRMPTEPSIVRPLIDRPPTYPEWHPATRKSPQPDVRNGGVADRVEPPPTNDPFAVSVSDSTVTSGAWEAELQRRRVEARSDTEKYNRMILEHLEMYLERGVDPCGSAFFPQGCQ